MTAGDLLFAADMFVDVVVAAGAVADVEAGFLLHRQV